MRRRSFVAIDGLNGETLHVFDARLNRWASVSGTASMTIKISRHTAMAHDGQFAYGFGQPSGEWFRESLQTLPSSFDTASSIGTVLHGNLISVYSVQGSLSYTGRYPEFTQAINLGNTLTMHQVGPAGSALVMLAGVKPTRIDLGAPLGILYVDPTELVILGLPQAIGTDGIAEIKIPVPKDPELVGLQIHLQDLVVPPAAAPWLSSSVAPVLF